MTTFTAKTFNTTMRGLAADGFGKDSAIAQLQHGWVWAAEYFLHHEASNGRTTHNPQYLTQMYNALNAQYLGKAAATRMKAYTLAMLPMLVEGETKSGAFKFAKNPAYKHDISGFKLGTDIGCFNDGAPVSEKAEKAKKDKPALDVDKAAKRGRTLVDAMVQAGLSEPELIQVINAMKAEYAKVIAEKADTEDTEQEQDAE